MTRVRSKGIHHPASSDPAKGLRRGLAPLPRSGAYVASRWFTVLLLVACSLFAASAIRDRLAVREVELHLAQITAMGGGVLFVMSVADCLETADMTARVADGLETYGIAVRGLVIRDGIDPAAMQGILQAANARFPHVAIGGREAAAFVGRAGTPVAFGVGSSGEVWVSERFGLEGATGANALAGRLRRAVTAGR